MPLQWTVWSHRLICASWLMWMLSRWFLSFLVILGHICFQMAENQSSASRAMRRSRIFPLAGFVVRGLFLIRICFLLATTATSGAPLSGDVLGFCASLVAHSYLCLCLVAVHSALCTMHPHVSSEPVHRDEEGEQGYGGGGITGGAGTAGRWGRSPTGKIT